MKRRLGETLNIHISMTLVGILDVQLFKGELKGALFMR